MLSKCVYSMILDYWRTRKSHAKVCDMLSIGSYGPNVLLACSRPVASGSLSAARQHTLSMPTTHVQCPTMSNPLILSRQTTCRLRVMLPFVIQISALGSTHSIPGASFTLTLQRRPQYYMLNIIIPTIVLAALSALNFAVPVDSGEKLSLGISILLAFSVFMLILQDNTPQADTPVLGEYTRVQWTVVDMLIYPSEKKRLCSKARWLCSAPSTKSRTSSIWKTHYYRALPF